jgi:hypothetical protein
MKGQIRKPAHSVYRDRSPGPRELKRRAFENLYAKADVGSKPKPPRPPETPQKVAKP